MVYTAPAKVNIFLKIVGRRSDGYHLISSRFIRHDSLSDKLWFEKAGIDGFSVVGDFECAMEHNTIYKAFIALKSTYPSKELAHFAKLHKVVVYKSIPSGAGLGGGSSDAATFLQMINKEAELGLSQSDLINVGVKVGADVPFFLSGHKSANVGGIGEVTDPFDEPLPILELFTPDIHCDTAAVYRKFRQQFSKEMELNKQLSTTLSNMTSKQAIASYDNSQLNDLLAPALKCYPELLEHRQDGWFFSGSGSTFFRILR